MVVVAVLVQGYLVNASGVCEAVTALGSVPLDLEDFLILNMLPRAAVDRKYTLGVLQLCITEQQTLTAPAGLGLRPGKCQVMLKE